MCCFSDPQQQARQEVDEFVDVEEVGEGAAGPPCSAGDQQEPNSAATVFTSLAWEEWRSWNNTQDNHLAAQRSSQNAPLDLTHKVSALNFYSASTQTKFFFNN